MADDQVKAKVLNAMRDADPGRRLLAGALAYRDATKIGGEYWIEPGETGDPDRFRRWEVKPLSECAAYVRSIAHLA